MERPGFPACHQARLAPSSGGGWLGASSGPRTHAFCSWLNLEAAKRRTRGQARADGRGHVASSLLQDCKAQPGSLEEDERKAVMLFVGCIPASEGAGEG